MKTKRFKKFSTVVLSLLMAASMMPSMAFAESLPDGADSDGIIYPTVNFTDVAPFLDPVEGVSPRTYARSMARTMSITPQADDSTTDNGMKISKTATANDDGSYTIKLEAYATGSKVISEVTEDVPTDIVLVLDQSGSMAEKMPSVTFEEYSDKTNGNYYSNRHNGGNQNLWYKLSDGSYAQVSVEVTGVEPKYTAYIGETNTKYWDEKDNLYVMNEQSEYQKVTFSREWKTYYYSYTYSVDGNIIATGYDKPLSGSSVPSVSFYSLSDDYSNALYTYTYKDADNVIHGITSSTGEDTICSTILYQKVTNNDATRLDALKAALEGFTEAVNIKAAGKDGDITTTEDNINHRIAVVGYAYGDEGYDNDPAYTNTEVFIGNTEYKYGNSARSIYGSAFQNMNTQAGRDNISSSINALTANGATYTNLGVEMANGILKANPVQLGEKRNRVIIVFTDGTPGWNGYESDVATSAIEQGKIAKDNGVSVYTVGVFSGADATSAGSNASNATEPQKANWFMQNLSSNNGTVQTPSYYLSAADADTLNNIFEQISKQIENGGTSATLSSETVIKDIISPQFTLPEGATANDITLETYSCKGADANGYIWAKNQDAMGENATVNGDQVSVTGFDFAANYVGTETAANGNVTYRGNKLVISFTVKPKDGFLGGNNVYTNTNAGVYENSAATAPVLTFEKPQVNVPINDVTVTAADKNVYLLGSLTAGQLKSGTTVTVGGVSLNLNPTAENFGLETWQTDYVNITVEIKDETGNTVSSLNDLRSDQSYTVSVTVSPKSDGNGASGTVASGNSDSSKANINVFKPVVTFNDSNVYYGADAPEDYDGNYVNTVWKHGESDTSNTSIIGTAPTLTFSYLAGTGIEAGKVNTKNDIPVDVTTTTKIDDNDVDVSAYTTYVHQNCEGKTCDLQEGKEFLLHVKTCQLTITKEGGVAGEPYVFNVMKRNADGTDSLYTTMTITGNGSKTISELPVGIYTVTEDTNWSWRYGTPTITGSGTLTSTSPNGVYIIRNTNPESGWLNDFSAVVENVFGVSRPSAQQ